MAASTFKSKRKRKKQQQYHAKEEDIADKD
jgi:hypothetical protein